MSFIKLCLIFIAMFFVIHSVQAEDEEENLMQGINSYRKSLNLTALAQNDNAGCLAKQIAKQFKEQPCSNTTGSNTVPGTENQFSNYPELLSNCHLDMSNTRDGAILPACVPGLDSSLVLSNFTKSQYSSNLNDTKYTGAGIDSEGDWIVVVMTTNTSGGSFETATASGDSFVSIPGSFIYQSVLALCGFLLLMSWS